MLIKGLVSSSAGTNATGELGALFLPQAVGTPAGTYATAGFSISKYASYDDDPYNDLAVHYNRVTVTPPALGTPCRAATTANISLSGLQTIDGIALIAGDRVLTKNQTTATQNGIYTVASGSWTRATDNDTGTELQNRIFFQVTSGTVNAGYYAAIQNTGTITIGTTAIIYDMILSPVLLESQTVYFLRFKNFPTGSVWYATNTFGSPILPKLATTANITLSGLQTIDGVLTVYGDLVLVKNQTVPSENGFYTVTGGSGWSRYTYVPFIYSSASWLVYVLQGTANGGRTVFGTTATSMKLYPTLADATAETNALIPSYRMGFGIEWITKPYTPIACVEMAAASVADIYCCPEPTPLLQTFPDHVELNFAASGSLAAETVVLRLFDTALTEISAYDGATYSGLAYFDHYEYDAPILCSGVSRTNLRRSFRLNPARPSTFFNNRVITYRLSSGADPCTGPYTYGTDYFTRDWKEPESYSYSGSDFTQTAPQEYEAFGTHSAITGSPTLTSYTFRYAQTIPLTISCYLVNAVFQDTATGTPSVYDLAIGTISVTLTYDAASSTYYGPVANYYNIPGRLSMPIGLLPTVESGSKFLEVTSYNWKVNSSNQIYYEKYLSSGAPSNTITLFYSSYSDARKPQASTLNFYKTNSYSVYTNTNGSLLRSDPTTQTATP